MTLLTAEIDAVRRSCPVALTGRVSTLRGLTLLCDQLPSPVGSLVEIGAGRVPGEVVGFEDGRTIVMTLGGLAGVRPGDPVRAGRAVACGPVSLRALGRVLNGMGEPIDGAGPLAETVEAPLDPEPITALNRRRIDEPLRTGVRAIDLMTPLGKGQRLGVFAGPGVGKSTLLGQIARGTGADASVIALIGERGREVQEFIEDSLGRDGLERSVVFVATGDESPLMRIRAAKLACATAELLRSCGLDVLLMMDSITRFAHAQRQVGLSAGEPPATRGYTPSVFAELGRLLERAGRIADGGGSITGLYTVLVEGDDMTEPVADAARGILDGHVVLSRKLAHRGHFPAIDVLDSISRVAGAVTDKPVALARQRVLRLLAKYTEVEDLVQIGAYAAGSDPETDAAIVLKPEIDRLLRQGEHERADSETMRAELTRLATRSVELLRGAPPQQQGGNGS